MNSKTTCVMIVISLMLSCGNLFAQDVEEEQPELFELVIGFNEERFGAPFTIIDEAFREELKNAGFSFPSNLSSEDDVTVTPLWFQVIDSTRTEVRNAILEEISEDELKGIQQRCLLFNFYSDWQPVTYEDIEEGGRIYLVSEVLFNPCEIFEFSPEQEQLYQEIRNNTVQTMFMISAEKEILYQEIATQYQEMEENETDSEVANKKIDKIREKINQLEWNGIKKINKNFHTQLENILTDKQKAKLHKMKDEMPESLWKIIPGNDGKERPWRPGAHSWMPGMGVPEDLENHPGEKRRSHSGDSKQFPEQE